MAKKTRSTISQAVVRNSIIETVAKIVRIDISELKNEVLIREELGIDSLKAMEIVAMCEKQLNIAIDEGQLFNIKTVGDFLDLLEGLYIGK